MGNKLVAASLSLGVLQGCGSSVSPVAPAPPPVTSPAPTPTPSAPLPIAGAYRLQIIVDPECRDRFPKAFQAPTYDVEIKTVSHRSETWFLNPDVEAAPNLEDPPGIGVVHSFENGGSYDLLFSFMDVHSLGEINVYSYYVEVSTVSSLPIPPSKQLSGPLFGGLSYADPSTAGDCTSSSHGFALIPR